ncbi:hypothetical protein BH11MYX4_BH11MYX4_35240 [soil metagenome]
MKALQCLALFALVMAPLAGCATDTDDGDDTPAPATIAVPEPGAITIKTAGCTYKIMQTESRAYDDYRQCTVAHPNTQATDCKTQKAAWIKANNAADAAGCFG